MNGIPAYCPRCGITFDTDLGIGAVGLTVEACITECPQCGGAANYLEGKFTQQGDLLQVISGSSFTRLQIHLMNQLQAKLAQRTVMEQVVTDDVVEAAKAISPALGEAVRLAKERKYPLAIIVGFLGLATAQCQGGITINVDNSTHVTNVYKVDAPDIPIKPERSKVEQKSAGKGAPPNKTKQQPSK